jgi:hypothetical protein
METIGRRPAKTLRCRMGASREDLARAVADMDREGLIRMLKKMQCTFRLDFTDEFLRAASIERLRHIVLSASLHLRARSPSPV